MGTRTSKSQYNKMRITQGFETPTEVAKPKSHTPNMDNIKLGAHTEEMLVYEIQSQPDGKINWSAIARKYQSKRLTVIMN